MEDSIVVKNAIQDSKHYKILSMCRGLISHNSRVNMGTTIIRIIIRIRAKGGVITRETRIKDGGTIRIPCHHPE